MSLIVVVLIELPFARHLLVATLIVSIASFFDYLYVGIKQSGNEETA